MQSVQWQTAASHRGENRNVTFRYIASVFSSADAARSALGDARASLWELGRPVTVTQAASRFDVIERDGHRNTYIVVQQGSIEAELRLRSGASLARASLQWSQWYLERAMSAVQRLIAKSSVQLPTTPGTSPGVAAPEVFVAPWGTGPVVKSPSLMVIDTLSADQGADPGAYRPALGPLLASRSAPIAALLPRGSLSHFVRTAGTEQGNAWYDSATLYASVPAASIAFRALTAGTEARGWLTPYNLRSADALLSTEVWSAWHGHGEVVLFVRIDNAVLVVATSGESPTSAESLVGTVVDKVPTWLHGLGTRIVNERRTPVPLASLNWYGAEQNDFVVGGLDFRSYRNILDSVAQLGYTGIRLPFSNQMVEQNPVVTSHLAANPDLSGLHALDIMDRIVAYAGALGLTVVLDNHRSDAGWSSQESGLWYTPTFPDAAFIHDWTTMASRYAHTNVVIGADLRNEPHGSATWGDGNVATDWRLAAQRAGNAVLATNPHILVIVEGTQYAGGSGSYWWGGNLMGVATAPVTLTQADGSSGRSQLVYSAHDYGPDNCASGCPWFNAATTYDTLAATWDQFWGFIRADPSKPYAAPVWVGEFGTCNFNTQCVTDTRPGSQGQWFSSLIQYIATKHLGWAYWSANGTESTGGERIYGTLDWYGFFGQDWNAPVAWLNAALSSIQRIAAEQ
ncbi:MAG: hypothetical protein PVSMB7_16340 [Chloroflexota bacterium]